MKTTQFFNMRRIIFSVFLTVILAAAVNATSLTSESTGMKFPLTFRPGFELVIPMVGFNPSTTGSIDSPP